jgi:hypothetical protein
MVRLAAGGSVLRIVRRADAATVGIDHCDGRTEHTEYAGAAMTDREVVREQLATALYLASVSDIPQNSFLRMADAVFALLTRNQEAMRERCAADCELAGCDNDCTVAIRALPVQIVVEDK